MAWIAANTGARDPLALDSLMLVLEVVVGRGMCGMVRRGVALHELVQEMVISRTDVLADGGVVLTVSLCLVISTSLLAEWRSVWP